MRRVSAGAVLWFLAGIAVNADDLPKEVVRLARFKQAVRETLSQIPNYTCLESIQRYGFEHHGRAFQPLDTVQVEISNLGDKEILSWPGARRFAENSVSDFAAGGMMSSGVFALHARTVFLADTTTIQYHGEEEFAGHMASRYDFRVPQAWSGYQIHTNGLNVTVGTRGSFWIDAESLELLRLEVRADDPPPSLGIENHVTVIEYARARIGEADVLLPQSARVLTTRVSGDALRNDIEFSHCREFVADSTIHFDIPAASAVAASPAVRQVDVPGGLTITIELQTAVDAASAKVGQLLSGRVVDDVRRKGQLIVPKGALATGRIRSFSRVRSPEPGIELTVEFEELAWEGAHAQFYAEMQSVPAGDSLLAMPAIDGGLPTVPSSSGSAAMTGVAGPQIPGTAVLHLKTQFRLKPGFRMSWRTLEPNVRRRAK